MSARYAWATDDTLLRLPWSRTLELVRHAARAEREAERRSLRAAAFVAWRLGLDLAANQAMLAAGLSGKPADLKRLERDWPTFAAYLEGLHLTETDSDE